MAITFKRVSQKQVLYLIVGVWSLFVIGWLYSYKSPDTIPWSIYDEEYAKPQDNPSNPDEPIKFNAMKNSFVQSMSKKLNIKDHRTTDAHSFVYDHILENHELEAIMNHLSFEDRCDLYFKNLYVNDNNWVIDPKESVKEDQFMVDMLSHVRIFNKCYITNDETREIASMDKLVNKEKSLLKETTDEFRYTEKENLISSESLSSCNELESRIYRWLSFAFPVYERWTGDTHLSPPNMKDFVEYPEPLEPSNPKFKVARQHVDSKFKKKEPCFLNEFKNSLNGKGLVLSIGEQHIRDTVRLIHLLRALNNHYPIQIVYHHDLKPEWKSQIVNAARNRMTDLPQSFESVKHMFGDDYFNIEQGGLPKQEIWFVNAQNAIHDAYREKFEGWFNKFVAALFNSFEEFMLIDADTALLKNPDYFFKLKDYIDTGGYFYRDRVNSLFRPEEQFEYWQSLTPSLLDNLVFDIPIITKFTLENPFFQGLFHLMESGVVLINRDLHFSTILNMVQLSFFDSIRPKVHGDKEIFWLGFAVGGVESYHFNKHSAAAVGTLTPDSNRMNNQGKPKKAKEICSNHPGHVSDEDDKTLVWINGGFEYCGQSFKVDFESEFTKSRYTFGSVQELKDFYEGTIPLTHAIIPPFKNTKETYCPNNADEPERAWAGDNQYCMEYLWCAYSSIGGPSDDNTDNTQKGILVKFEPDFLKYFKYLADVWFDNE